MGPHYYKGSNCFEFHFLETQMSLLMHTHAHIYLCPPPKGGMLGGWWKTKLNSLATYCKSSLMHSVLAPKLMWGSDKETGPWEVKELEDLVPTGHLLKLGSQDCSVLPSEAWYVLSPSYSTNMGFLMISLYLRTKGKLVYLTMKETIESIFTRSTKDPKVHKNIQFLH